MTDPIEEIVSPVRFWQGDIVRTPSGIIALVTSDSNTGVSIAVNLIGPWERGSQTQNAPGSIRKTPPIGSP